MFKLIRDALVIDADERRVQIMHSKVILHVTIIAKLVAQLICA